MKAVLLVVCAVLLAGKASCLSWPLCDTVGSTWVSSTPHLSGSYPYYQLLFFCTGNLNIEGSGVDVCINNGQDCGQPAADAFCQYAGYDGAVEDQTQTVQAYEPVRAVTGEWCLSPGSYSSMEATSASKLPAPAPGANLPLCQRIDSLVCYRRRSSLAASLTKLRTRLTGGSPGPAPGPQAKALAPALAPTAAAAPTAFALPSAGRPVLTGSLPATAATRAVEVGGRRLRF